MHMPSLLPWFFKKERKIKFLSKLRTHGVVAVQEAHASKGDLELLQHGVRHTHFVSSAPGTAAAGGLFFQSKWDLHYCLKWEVLEVEASRIAVLLGFGNRFRNSGNGMFATTYLPSVMFILFRNGHGIQN